MPGSPDGQDPLPDREHIDWRATRVISVVAVVFWSLELWHAFGDHRDHRDHRDAERAANSLVDHGEVPEETDTEPCPPRGQVAVFESAGADAYAVAFAPNGVDYDVAYVETTAAEFDVPSVGGRNAFIANFIRGTRTGNPRLADVVIVIGDTRVRVGDLDGYARHRNDREASLGIEKAAVLSDDVGLRGEPSTLPWTTRKRLVVVGHMQVTGAAAKRVLATRVRYSACDHRPSR